MDKCLLCRYDSCDPASMSRCTNCDGITEFSISPARLFTFIGFNAWKVDQKRVIRVKITGFTYRADRELYFTVSSEGEESTVHINNFGRLLYLCESEARLCAARN